MKRKLISLAMVATLLIGVLAACGQKTDQGGNNEGTTTPPSSDAKGAELALITDVGTIDDKSFNQGAWEGLKKYADENDISHQYYQPAEKTTAAYLASINIAIEAGAKVIITPGFFFEPAVFEAQKEHPDIKFILIDGIPRAEEDTTYQNPVIAENTQSIFYAEQEAGFLAGYAAVKEGYTKLGFMGGVALPPVVKFGYGFLQGAEYAAKEMGIPSIDVKYNYTGGFAATPEAQARAASWYQSGTEVIFACGGAVGNSVMAAAEASGGKVIGVDVDQSAESETVITSSMKMLQKSVYDAVASYYADSFQGGTRTVLTVKEGGVGLPMANSKFAKFTQQDYDAIYQELVDGQVTIISDVDDAKKPVEIKGLPLSIVKVEEIA